MSGYRTLHRIEPPEHEAASPRAPLWRVRFSPCRSSSTQPSSLRLLAAGPSSTIHCFSLADRTNKDPDSHDVLDASALRVERTEVLASAGQCRRAQEGLGDGAASRALGYAALDIARNDCGADPAAGHEVVAAAQLGGTVRVWCRLDPASVEKGATMAETVARVAVGEDAATYVPPHVEFSVTSATGTTLAIRPPALAHHYSKKETDVLVAVGCANGAVLLCNTGILAARPGRENAVAAGTVVGDSSSSSAGETVQILSDAAPGAIVATVGGGHACVMSLAFHPTVPNALAVGRKDGSVDLYSASASGGPLSFRRMHRLVHSSSPLRALAFSRPAGALLFAGDDGGALYSYDASCNLRCTQLSAPVKLVACALTAHKGWVMDLAPFADGKRVATCGSDGAVRVWDCGMGLASSTPVHSFAAHDGLVWGVDCGGEKLVSCGDDGVMEIFACGE